MRIHSITIFIVAYISSTILFAAALPTPFPSSNGISPCNAVGTDSIQDLTLNNVCNEADKVTGPPPTTFVDERDLQARGNPSQSRLYIGVPQDLQGPVSASGLPNRIDKPADPLNITPEEQSHVNEILRILDASVAGLPYENKLRRQFLNFRGRVNREFHYNVNSYTKPHHRYVSIPSPLRDIQPDIPERITAPASRFKITEQEQQHVYDILLKLKASLEGASSKDERCTQFTRLKGFLNRDLGYKVDIGKLVWEVTTVEDNGDPGTGGSGGQKLVTFFEPVGQASGSSGDTSTVPPPPPV